MMDKPDFKTEEGKKIALLCGFLRDISINYNDLIEKDKTVIDGKINEIDTLKKENELLDGEITELRSFKSKYEQLKKDKEKLTRINASLSGNQKDETDLNDEIVQNELSGFEDLAN